MHVTDRVAAQRISERTAPVSAVLPLPHKPRHADDSMVHVEGLHNLSTHSHTSAINVSDIDLISLSLSVSRRTNFITYDAKRVRGCCVVVVVVVANVAHVPLRGHIIKCIHL